MKMHGYTNYNVKIADNVTYVRREGRSTHNTKNTHEISEITKIIQDIFNTRYIWELEGSNANNAGNKE
jgi:hypothetical protein